jgi:hypothetical protein
MPTSNVVPKMQPLTEEAFRGAWLQSLARLCKLHGDDKVALWLSVSVVHLRKNLKSGLSLPTADKMWNLLAFDDSAHDELDSEFGLKNVHRDAVCTTDPLTLDVIGLANETAHDEAEDSPGGAATTDHELLLKDEARLRKVYRVLSTWLDRIDRLRAPTGAARLRAVNSSPPG